MKIYQDINEIPEYSLAKDELEKVVTVVNEANDIMNKNADFMIAALNRLQDERDQVEKALEKARAQLVAQEMHGKSSSETAKEVNFTIAELERIDTTLEAFARSGGMTLNILEKKLAALNIKKVELEREKAWREMFPVTGFFKIISQAAKDKQVKEAIAASNALDAEIVPIQKTVDLLRANKKKYGSLISTDADTAKAAQKAFGIAAEVWAAREKLKAELINQLEQTREEIDRLKLSANLIYEAMQEMDPDSVTEYLWSHDIGIAVMPEIYKEIDAVSMYPGEKHWRRYLGKGKVRAEIRKHGQELMRAKK